MAVQLNPDLPLSWDVPGVYLYLDLSGGGAAPDDPSRRLLVLAYQDTATATWIANTPRLPRSQSEVNTGAGTGSDAARIYAACQSQVGPGVVELWVCPVAPASGDTAATYTMTFAGPATSAGSVTVYVCGYRATAAVADDATATTVATAVYTALGRLQNLPVTITDSGSGTLTLTYRHKGLVGNDLPIMVDIEGATGISVSPGTVTLSSNPSGNGTISLVVGATTISSSIDSAVQTTAALAATKLITDINAGSYPVTATSGGSGIVTLLYRSKSGQPVRRISVSDSVATMTSAVSLHGTTGVGAPDLTAAMAAIEAMGKGFAGIITPFNDSASLGTYIYPSILVQSNGSTQQKDPFVFLGSAESLTGAGAVVTAPSPDLTASPRFAVAWAQEVPEQAVEIAARLAAIYVESDYAPHNFEGSALKTRSGVPLLNMGIPDQPTLDDQQSAVDTYHLAPIAVNSSDQLVIVRGRTTSNAEQDILHSMSVIRHLAYLRRTFNAELYRVTRRKVIRDGDSKTPNSITVPAIRQALIALARTLDSQDLYNDAEAWIDGFVVERDGTVPTRINVFIPAAAIPPLVVTSGVLSPV